MEQKIIVPVEFFDIIADNVTEEELGVILSQAVVNECLSRDDVDELADKYGIKWRSWA